MSHFIGFLILLFSLVAYAIDVKNLPNVPIYGVASTDELESSCRGDNLCILLLNKLWMDGQLIDKLEKLCPNLSRDKKKTLENYMEWLVAWWKDYKDAELHRKKIALYNFLYYEFNYQRFIQDTIKDCKGEKLDKSVK